MDVAGDGRAACSFFFLISGITAGNHLNNVKLAGHALKVIAT